jgi:hypothetical protein
MPIGFLPGDETKEVTKEQQPPLETEEAPVPPKKEPKPTSELVVFLFFLTGVCAMLWVIIFAAVYLSLTVHNISCPSDTSTSCEDTTWCIFVYHVEQHYANCLTYSLITFRISYFHKANELVEKDIGDFPTFAQARIQMSDYKTTKEVIEFEERVKDIRVKYENEKMKKVINFVQFCGHSY